MTKGTTRIPAANRLWLKWASGACLLTNLLLLAWYIFQGYKHVIHGDSASRVLLAQEIVESGKLFPPDWFYVNGDILSLSTHLAILPLLGALPAGFLVHAISSMIFASLVLHGAWLLTGILALERERRVLVLAVLAGGISSVSVDFLFGQLTYGVILGSCFYLVFLAYRAARETQKRRKRILDGLLGLLCFAACSSNPKRAAIYYFVPLAAALALQAFHNAKLGLAPDLRRVFTTGWMAFLGFLSGALFYFWLAPSLLITPGVDVVRLAPAEDIVRNMTSLWGQYIETVAGRVPTKDLLTSATGLAFAGRLGIAVMLVWLVCQACGVHFQKPLSGAAFLGVYATSLTLLLVAIQVTTSLPGSGRFLLPGLVCLLVLTLATPLDFWAAPIRTLAVLFTLISFIGASWPVLYTDVRTAENVKERRERQALQHFLEDNGLSYGYAPMNDAAPLSVMSDGKVLVRSIIVVDGLPIPAPWISSLRWYKPGAWSSHTFLMLTPEQSGTVDWTAMQGFGIAPTRRLTFGKFIIWVFEDNIASHGLPGWPNPMQFIEKRQGRLASPSQG